MGGQSKQASCRQQTAGTSFILSESEWRGVVRVMALTPRQADIVRLLLCGKRDKQIASSLKIGLPTVRTHLRILYAAHGLDDRVELVIRAFAIARETSDVRCPHPK